MSKTEWLRHADEVGYRSMQTWTERKAHAAGCRACKARARTLRANRSARERNEALRDLGLVKTPYGWE